MNNKEEKNKIQREISDLWEVGKKSSKRTNRLVEIDYILDGLLIGAAVGAGFAAFETAGYILRFGLNSGLEAMLEIIKLRGFLVPGGHVA